jgi:competence protein ComEC
MKKKLSYLTLGLLLSVIVFLVLSLPSQKTDGRLHLKVYDVGQGDAIFIRTPQGYKILVDGGPNNRVLDHLGRELAWNDRRIDFVILTHPQADHMAGLVEVIKRYEVGQVLISGVEHTTKLYQSWSEALAEKQIKPRIVKQGDEIGFPDGAKIRFLWPREERPIVSDLNMASLVLRLDFGEFNAELTGDADSQVQPYTSTTSEVEVLKVPHHGSRTALNQSYLKQISPEISIISVGEKNSYGHPNQVLLNQLLGTKIFRTDLNGTVEVVSDGKSWYTSSEKGN